MADLLSPRLFYKLVAEQRAERLALALERIELQLEFYLLAAVASLRIDAEMRAQERQAA